MHDSVAIRIKFIIYSDLRFVNTIFRTQFAFVVFAKETYDLIKIGGISKMHELCKRVKQIRLSTGMVQLDFATLCGIGSGTLSDIESGRRVPTLRILEKIATAMKITVAEVLDVKQTVKPEYPPEILSLIAYAQGMDKDDVNLLIHIAKHMEKKNGK